MDVQNNLNVMNHRFAPPPQLLCQIDELINEQRMCRKSASIKLWSLTNVGPLPLQLIECI
jgi:hypothetical protein